MKLIQENIDFLNKEWNKPKQFNYDGLQISISCHLNDGESELSIIECLKHINISDVPSDYLNFLRLSNGGVLFKDESYGQQGLHLYTLKEIQYKNDEWRSSYRKESFITGDLIIGEFYGDSDLVLLRCHKSSDDFGSIIISLPMDERSDWYYPASNFSIFLSKFVQNEGHKYWE